ncbi:hypothetical protein [Myxacorys almedinensis]|uniref:Uncharacterized protein n=1 Tax=Myxacorys almedinensis A TaxID=2690445 RepID=A0A8J8CKX0_9CYAN|nr:hypothetical protein [Myxacorys almedinensis]NDJ17090.1 hypothetical protein [Myxacorys almedinensis A]
MNFFSNRKTDLEYPSFPGATKQEPAIVIMAGCPQGTISSGMLNCDRALPSTAIALCH